MRFYEIVGYTMVGALFFGLLVFGFDRDMARRSYNQFAENGDYEQKIAGCLYEINCEYYTNLLTELEK